MELTQKRLKYLLKYDPATGLFTRRVRTSQMNRAGEIAGTRTGLDYVRISVDGLMYLGQRLVWLYVHGEVPVGDLDHIDGDKQNNRLSNLREVSRSVNMQNISAARANNKSGLLGVCRHGKNYRAQIKLDGVRHTLGSYKTPEEAHAAYIAAKASMHAGYVA